MKKKDKIKHKNINILIIVTSIFIVIFISFLLILIKLTNSSIRCFIDNKKQSNSIVTQKSFIISNESGSIKKEIPIKPASVGDIKFEQNSKYMPRPTFTPVIRIPSTPAADVTLHENKFSCLFKAVDSKDDIYKIDIEAAKFLFDSGKAIFIDARSKVEYKESHIKGAVLIPTNATPEEINNLKNILKGKVLVTYCHGVGCHLSDKVAYKLYDMGYRNIAIFFSGWNIWNEYNYPIEK